MMVGSWLRLLSHVPQDCPWLHGEQRQRDDKPGAAVPLHTRLQSSESGRGPTASLADRTTGTTMHVANPTRSTAGIG